MTPLDVAEEFLRTAEGFRPEAYQDSKGVWTIGIGTTVIGQHPVTASTPPCTLEQAEAWLSIDMADANATVKSGVTAPATVNQIAAFISFAYNEGDRAFKGSTLLHKFNLGDVAGCEAEFRNWIFITERGVLVPVDGLINRRAAEVALFKTASPEILPAAAAPAAAPPAAPSIALRLGSKGPRVEKLQQSLAVAGYYTAEIDGDFGPVTLDAVMKYDIDHDLDQVSEATLAALAVT